jgi:mRNA interferase HicA
MKSSELHKLLEQAGWKAKRQRGSHVIYEKEGAEIVAPSHGSKEVPTGLEKKIKKQAGL